MSSNQTLFLLSQDFDHNVQQGLRCLLHQACSKDAYQILGHVLCYLLGDLLQLGQVKLWTLIWARAYAPTKILSMTVHRTSKKLANSTPSCRNVLLPTVTSLIFLHALLIRWAILSALWAFWLFGSPFSSSISSVIFLCPPLKLFEVAFTHNYASGCECGLDPLSTTTTIFIVYTEPLLVVEKWSGFDLNDHLSYWCNPWRLNTEYSTHNFAQIIDWD